MTLHNAPHNLWVSNNEVGMVPNSMHYQSESAITQMLASLTLPSETSSKGDVVMEDAAESKGKARMKDEIHSEKDYEGDDEMSSNIYDTPSFQQPDLKRRRDSSDQGDDGREEIKKRATDARAIDALRLANWIIGERMPA